ncbi:MAG: metallophosphoesterase family protein [Gammaproteobacteria bacterium]
MDQYCIILHLSDLHFGETGAHLFRQNEISGAMHAFLPSLEISVSERLLAIASERSGLIPDLIVLSGDYTCAWESDDVKRRFAYTLTNQFISHVLSVVNQLRQENGRTRLLKESVVIIPGNHDVRRDDFEKRYTPFFRDLIKGFYGDNLGAMMPHAAGAEEASNVYLAGYNPDQSVVIVGVDSNEAQDNSRKIELAELMAKLEDPSVAQGDKQKLQKLFDDYYPGFVNTDTLDAFLKGIRKSHPHAVLGIAVHHHLSGALQSVHDPDYRPIINNYDVLEVLAKYEVAFSLHGHKHVPGVTSIYHKCKNRPSGWHLPAIACGSMCDPKHWSQPGGVKPSFNIICIPVPIPVCAYHIQVYVQEANSKRKFSESTSNDYLWVNPLSVRVETKDHIEDMLAMTADVDQQIGQANWKLFCEMDFIRKLGDVTLRTDKHITDYAAALSSRTEKLENGSIWMTCCVSPRYLFKRKDNVQDTLDAFVDASKKESVDVRRLFVLTKDNYNAIENDRESLDWFWRKAVSNSTMKTFCTRSDWL